MHALLGTACVFSVILLHLCELHFMQMVIIGEENYGLPTVTFKSITPEV